MPVGMPVCRHMPLLGFVPLKHDRGGFVSNRIRLAGFVPSVCIGRREEAKVCEAALAARGSSAARQDDVWAGVRLGLGSFRSKCSSLGIVLSSWVRSAERCGRSLPRRRLRNLLLPIRMTVCEDAPQLKFVPLKRDHRGFVSHKTCSTRVRSASFRMMATVLGSFRQKWSAYRGR